jgi:Domain of unknown function (DUF4126)
VDRIVSGRRQNPALMIASLLTSAGLGLGAGINAYATLLVFGLLARWQPTMFHDDMARFFASTPVLIVVGVLYLVEFLADKVPAVDHIWDVIHTLIRPAAGALVAWAAVSDRIPHGAVIVASVIAGGAALGSHATKATLRGASTLMTGGLGNPILSLLEDGFAFVNAVVVIVLPWVVIPMLFVMTLLFVTAYRRLRRVRA